MDLLNKNGYQYLLTNKVYPDHIEMFFGKIQQRNGWNNNPTSEQFRSSLKSLTMSSSITPSRHGNAASQDDTLELTLTPSSHEQPTAIEIQYNSALMIGNSNFDTLLMNDTD
ncbi:hypothetical protein RRG08_048347 [Elysia crispata]|uniref:Transposable element P transposase-like RNase H C-terminal domain-containing protein n=1 Tax=Elysia crispata TaxID=231223 RepID=A0AAE0YGR4_9GAST|nr:hypothetical protein RRG08_048347 [Elysia crispata]